MVKQTTRRGNRTITRFGASRRALLMRPYNPFYGNDTSAYRPEVWASEAVRLLWEKMVYAGLVHRDFENEIARFGETVHTRKPGTFVARRKQNDMDDVEEQNCTATDIEVKLNQRVQITFMLGDRERTVAFQDLFNVFLDPAMNGEASFLDRVVAGQVYQFRANRAGALGQMTSANAHDYLLDARQVMNDKKVSEDSRWMGLSSPSETQMQKTDLFKSAERVGDGGLALREAILGRKAGFNNFLGLNTPSVRGATKTATTTTTAASLAGSSTISMTAVTNLATGAYFTVVGDYTPLRVTAVNTLDVTTSHPLLRAIASGAVVQPYATGLIDQASPIAAGDTTAGVSDGYPAGWMKPIHVDGTGVPKLGQLVAFKTAGGAIHTAEYCIVQVDESSGDYEITLDRPLEQAVANNDVVNYGPDGDYNFFFKREALALVCRPLALPPEGSGVRAAAATFNNMSLRVTMQYDSKKEGTRVTVSGLFGVKPLNTDLAGTLLG